MITSSFSFEAGDITGGGVPHAVFYLSRALAAAGHEVSVLSQGTRRSQVPKSLNFRLLVPAATMEGTMMTLPVRNEFDVYHTHFSKGIRMELASMALRRRSKTVAHVHYTPARRVHSLSRTRLFYNLSDLVITPSAQNRQKLISSHSIEKSKVKVLPNGVDTEMFRFVPETVDRMKAEIGAQGRRVALFVGHYAAPSKGAAFLVLAARKVVAEFPDTLFLFVGHGPEDPVEQEYMQGIESLVTRSNLGKNVRFLGTVPHSRLPMVYSLADVFVQPSLWESFGMPAIEAMACSRPVVATKVGVAPEAVNPGVNGYVVEPRDAEGIAESVVRVLEGGAKPRMVGEEARRTAVERYDWGVVSSSLLRLYAEA